MRSTLKFLTAGAIPVLAAPSALAHHGFGTFILDGPDCEADLEHARIVFDHARRTIMEVA